MTLFDETPETTGPRGPSVRVRMTVAYDGGAFHGFAVQPNVETVAGALTLAIERAMQVKGVELVCAGRTDRGVHARGQVVSFDVPADTRIDTDQLVQRVNRQLAPRVVAREASVPESTFDARYDAKARRYRYSVLNAPVPDPLLSTQAWWVPQPLNVRSMRAACDPLLGEHDFAAFCRRPTPRRDGRVPGTMRRVIDAEWVVEGEGMLRFWIEANAFCHQMVRSIVGLLVEVGQGKRKAADVGELLRAGNRHGNADPAPAHGLLLWDVRY
ncbi:MAG: tRNA pseudouridine38-40 synthase [Actinomycetota bacterium]